MMTFNVYYNVYEKNLIKNEKNIIFWEKYLENLHALDFNVFAEKLTMPVLVPIGSRVLFRGQFKHTNEVTAALGADYFIKCSASQAEILRQHRIKDAISKLTSLKNERVYLKNQVSFTKENIHRDAGYNIVEMATEEEDKAWREKHRENVRKYKQRPDKSDEFSNCEMTNDELWQRLEELELQEELENELTNKHPRQHTPSTSKSHHQNDSNDNSHNNNNLKYLLKLEQKDEVDDEVLDNEIYFRNENVRNLFQQPSKLDLFDKVVERHNAIKAKVAELKNLTLKSNAKNEEDLAIWLDEMEDLETLEDEMAVLEDMLASDDDDDIEIADEEEDSENDDLKKVVFADNIETQTFQITFIHSDAEPSQAPYDPQKGIIKPSDICEAYASSFSGNTKPILKKPKCLNVPQNANESVKVKEEVLHNEAKPNPNTIVLQDVVERIDCNDNNPNPNARPMSLFKKRRQQQKE